MKKFKAACLIPLFLHCFQVSADRGPQDSWYLDRKVDLPEMPGFRTPYGVEVDASGNSFVVDRDNHSITIWDQNGSFLSRINYGASATDGRFNYPRDLAVSPNEIYVVDKDNHRIQVLDRNGSFLRKWGSYGTADGQLRNPVSIALDLNGSDVYEVYVADWDNHKVQVFDADGVFKRSIGVYGSGNDQIYHAAGVAKGPDGLIYVSNYAYSRVNVYETNGTFVRNFSVQNSPFDLDFYGDKLAVAHGNDHKTRIFDKNGTLLTTLGNGSSAEPGSFYHPFGLSYDPSGNLHVADSHNHRIQVFDSNLSYLRSYGSLGEPGVGPWNLQITPENTFLITDVERHRVFEMDLDGSLVRVIASQGNVDGRVSNPRGLFLAPSNLIYVADTNNHRIQVFDRNGSFIRKFGEIGSSDGQFNSPYAVLVSQNNEIYVADTNNHRVQVFDANGTFLRKFGVFGGLEGQINYLHDIAFSDQGNLMVADWNNRRIIHFSPAGEFIRHYTTHEHPMFVGNLPHGLTAISRDSRLEIYDENGDRLKVWTKPGGSSSAFQAYPNGDLVWLDYDFDRIAFYRSTYRTVRPPVSKEIPLPEVLSVVQSESTNHLEVTYRINDADSSSVKAKMIAFVDGGNDLSKVIVPTTFESSIVGKLDDNVSANQEHTVVWNVGADWSVGFGELEVAVMAQDDRDLLNLHFLTLPATDDNQTELVINRSPITDADLLDLWYWLLASGDASFEFSAANASISKPAPQNTGSVSLPNALNGLVLWLDANDSQSLTVTDGIVTQWNDKSGNDRHASKEYGSPTLETGGVNGLPFLSLRSASEGDESMPISGTAFFAKHMFFLCRSPHETWRGYGAILGHLNGRNSNFLLENGNTNFHSYRLPVQVAKNGLSLSASNRFDLSTITDFMILEVVVDDYDTSPKNNYYIGKSDWYSQDLDVSEIIAFDRELTAEREEVLLYMAQKSNLAVAGATLVVGSSTTASGRQFIFDRMNLRLASAEEVERAKSGAIPGTINQFTPSLKVGPDERPPTVNEYGFDTGANGYWVTPK